MHLTFPSFAVTTNIPEDGELRLPLEPLTKNDLGIPNFMCVRVPLQEKHLESLDTLFHFLNNALKGPVAGKDTFLVEKLIKGHLMTRS